MKTNRRKIIVRAVSVKGSLHHNKQMHCQDYCKHSIAKNFVAVVSDGAGSAKYGKFGAKIVCETLNDILKNSDFKKAKENIRKAIEIAREKLTLHRLNKSKSMEHVGDFAATVVGVICYKNKGMFFHIGDGAALALHECGKKFVISRPENGNFSCETFFYTQDDWKHNLRFTAFEDAASLFLMSDGLTNFAFSKDFSKIEEGFIKPINDFLWEEKTKAKAIRALNNTLNTPKAQKLNVDDKTLLWARL